VAIPNPIAWSTDKVKRESLSNRVGVCGVAQAVTGKVKSQNDDDDE
jgi:hypothetical protein